MTSSLKKRHVESSELGGNNDFFLPLKIEFRGTWLAQSVERASLDLGVVISSSTWVQRLVKNKIFKKIEFKPVQKIIAFEKSIGSVVLKVWSSDQQHQHHLGTCQKWRFPGPDSPTESEALRVGPSNLFFTGLPGDSSHVC